MKVKIKDKFYNTDDEPVMLVFETVEELEQVANDLTLMVPTSNRKYCLYPDTSEWTDNEYKKIIDWMKDDRPL